MALIKRLRRITAARIEAFLSTTENPEDALPQLVREMEKQAVLSGQAVAKALTALKASQRRLDELQGRIIRLDKGAKLAIDQGDEPLARDALAELVKTEKQEKIRLEAVAQAQQAVDEAREAKSRLDHQLENLRVNADGIISRSRAIKTQRTGQPGYRDNRRCRSILDRVADIEMKVDQDESEVELARRSRERFEATLEERLRKVERHSEIEARIRRLRDRSKKSDTDHKRG